MEEDKMEQFVRKFNMWLFGISPLSHDLNLVDQMKPRIQVRFTSSAVTCDIKQYLDNITGQDLYETYQQVSLYRHRIIQELSTQCAILYLIVCCFYLTKLNTDRYVVGHQHVEPYKDSCIVTSYDLILTYDPIKYD